MKAESYKIGEVIDEAALVLDNQGIGEGRRTAQLLMQHLLKIETAELITRLKEELTRDLIARYSGLLKRRLRREPLQYITRRVEFWGLEFYIDQRALIPRPESELIIEAVEKDFPEHDKPLSIVDVGTGSGCLAVVLALNYTKAKLFALDLEPGALEVASINSSRHNVTNRIKLLQGDLMTPLAAIKTPRKYNIVVSNPPYISLQEIPSLQPEVAKAEPKNALVAGSTGLEIFKRLIPQISILLKKSGRFYLECGAGQDEEVSKLISHEEELNLLRIDDDLQGIPRVLVGEKRS